MALDLFKERGVPLERQVFTWRELAGMPLSKLDDDAYTRVRVIFLNGIEAQSVRFQHTCARMNADLQLPLASVRRHEHHQQTMVNWLLPPDLTPLETTIAYEQAAVEVTAQVAQHEPDPYLAQAYRFGLLEDFDHLYRFSAMLDRVEGKDPNNILQSYTDIRPGRPTSVQHRSPVDDVRSPYDRRAVDPITRLNALAVLAAETQALTYYMNIGPTFADPVLRQLYAEIASIEEQHVTHYESLIDPSETWLEKWLLHEATEVYCYYSALQQEQNVRARAIWERFLSYELGHLHFVMDLFRTLEGRDPAEVLPTTLPEPISFSTQRSFVRSVLKTEVDLRAIGTQFIDKSQEPPGSASARCRAQLNSAGSPSEIAAAGYRWAPGTELMSRLGTHPFSTAPGRV